MAPDQLTVDELGTGAASTGRSAALVGALRSAFPDAVVVLDHPAVTTIVRGGKDRRGPVLIPSPEQPNLEQGGTYITYGRLEIGGPDLLRALHAEDGVRALRAGDVIGIGPGTIEGGFVQPAQNFSEQALGMSLPAVEAGETRYRSVTQSGEFTYVISPGRAAQLGFERSTADAYNSHIILRASTALDDKAIARARQIAASSPGAYVTTAADLGDHSGPVRLYALLGGGALALAIVAVVVALVAAESRRDQAILVAVGAAPRIRRAVAGASAATVAALAAVLAVPAAFIPAAVFFLADRPGARVVVPWTTFAMVVVAVPAIAGTVGALVSREPKAGQLLRPVA